MKFFLIFSHPVLGQMVSITRGNNSEYLYEIKSLRVAHTISILLITKQLHRAQHNNTLRMPYCLATETIQYIQKEIIDVKLNFKMSKDSG